MATPDWLAAIPTDDIRYPIAQAQLAYWRRRETGWTPARLLSVPMSDSEDDESPGVPVRP